MSQLPHNPRPLRVQDGLLCIRRRVSGIQKPVKEMVHRFMRQLNDKIKTESLRKDLFEMDKFLCPTLSLLIVILKRPFLGSSRALFPQRARPTRLDDLVKTAVLVRDFTSQPEGRAAHHVRVMDLFTFTERCAHEETVHVEFGC
jgi:hypothetical protein